LTHFYRVRGEKKFFLGRIERYVLGEKECFYHLPRKKKKRFAKERTPPCTKEEKLFSLFREKKREKRVGCPFLGGEGGSVPSPRKNGLFSCLIFQEKGKRRKLTTGRR